MKNTFKISMKVRDYECDSQGVVNNANYLNYLEYTRHEFLESLGISFMKLRQLHIEPVVARIDIQYKISLVGSDTFISRLTVKREGVKTIFYQELLREKDSKLACKATVEAVILQNGSLSRGDYFDEALAPYLANE